MDGPLYCSEQIQQILCRDRLIAIPPDNLSLHLLSANAHQHLQALERSNIEKQWLTRQLVISSAEQVAKQVDGREEVKGLNSIEGCCCLQCDHRTVSNKIARNHQLQTHPRSGFATAGRPRSSPGQTLNWTRAWMQSVFAPSREHYHLFIVQRTANTASERSSKQSGEQHG